MISSKLQSEPVSVAGPGNRPSTAPAHQGRRRTSKLLSSKIGLDDHVELESKEERNTFKIGKKANVIVEDEEEAIEDYQDDDSSDEKESSSSKGRKSYSRIKVEKLKEENEDLKLECETLKDKVKHLEGDVQALELQNRALKLENDTLTKFIEINKNIPGAGEKEMLTDKNQSSPE